jgi:hypothetical protein
MRVQAEPLRVPVSAGEHLLAWDITADGAGITVVATPRRRRPMVRFADGREVELRAEPDTRFGPFTGFEVAAFGAELAVVVARHSRKGTPNAFRLTPEGLERRFFVGDAVAGVIALPCGLLAVTYFSEGFDEPVSEEGVAVFGTDGELVGGYTSATGTRFWDCSAAVALRSSSIAFLPYPEGRLTVWDAITGTERTHLVPGTVRGARAISHRGDRWWFHTPSWPRRIFEWRLRSPKVARVGAWPGPLVGRPDGRFLTTGHEHPTAVRIER